MNPIERLQFKHRLTGADFHPRRRIWLAPVLISVCVVLGMCLAWN